MFQLILSQNQVSLGQAVSPEVFCQFLMKELVTKITSSLSKHQAKGVEFHAPRRDDIC